MARSESGQAAFGPGRRREHPARPSRCRRSEPAALPRSPRPRFKASSTSSPASAAPRSVRRRYSTLHAVFAYAVASDWLGRSPCRGINLPAVTTTRSRKLTAEQIGSIAAAHRDSFYVPWVVRYLEAVVSEKPSPIQALAMSFDTTEDRAAEILRQAHRRQLLPPATADWAKDNIIDHSRRLLAGPGTGSKVGKYEAMVWLGAVIGLRWSEVAGLRIDRRKPGHLGPAQTDHRAKPDHGFVFADLAAEEYGAREQPARMVDDVVFGPAPCRRRRSWRRWSLAEDLCAVFGVVSKDIANA